mgnify:CR=1 FL=1
MPWTTPKTWAVGAILPAAELNTYLRDNTNELKTPPTAAIEQTVTYSTTSTTYVDINAALNLSIVTNGGRLLVVARFTASLSSGSSYDIKWQLNGSDIEGAFSNSVVQFPGQCTVFWTGTLAAGTHAIKPQWRSPAAATLSTTFQSIVIREVS